MTPIYSIIFALMLIPIVWYLLILFLSKKKETSKKAYQGNTSFILICHNEELTVENKVAQLVSAQQQLNGKQEIIVISDGSTDQTNSILQSLANKYNFRHCIVPKRMGKAYALNLGISLSKYPILIVSDARQEISKDAIPHLLQPFNDPEIGATSSRIIHQGQASVIRKSINQLKTMESDTGSTIGVYGGLYAVRKECLQNLPINTILDDLLISLYVLNSEKRVIMVPEVIIYDISIQKYCTKTRILRVTCGLIRLPFQNINVFRKLSARQILYLYVQKYAKLLTPLFFILLTVIALFSSTEILIFHVLFFSTEILLFAILNRKVLMRLLRIFGICIFSVGSIKKYNTHLWEKNSVATQA
ncbi:MAG: cellulose synthase/poly-beta-1,6-N-acetylglucosamine synthase-like glycosyltransferase [Crocinitomix sp.]|jgi:cellulose synthase/poly-beta-1,6-N-acetylglucosamine synthase-like glycosyltransferase